MFFFIKIKNNLFGWSILRGVTKQNKRVILNHPLTKKFTINILDKKILKFTILHSPFTIT